MAEAASFVDKEFGRVAFVDEDDVDDEDGALDYAGEVLRPAPTEGRVGDKGSRYNGALYSC